MFSFQDKGDVTAKKCSLCKYPNDSTFRFCQRCGHQTILTDIPYSSNQTPLQYNINSSINQLEQLLNNTNCIKKKSKLANDFELFLDSHTDHDISSATPSDFRVFLVDKDKFMLLSVLVLANWVFMIVHVCADCLWVRFNH